MLIGEAYRLHPWKVFASDRIAARYALERKHSDLLERRLLGDLSCPEIAFLWLVWFIDGSNNLILPKIIAAELKSWIDQGNICFAHQQEDAGHVKWIEPSRWSEIRISKHYMLFHYDWWLNAVYGLQATKLSTYEFGGNSRGILCSCMPIQSMQKGIAL